ncbi:NUDIX hydrolase [Sanyastnella coralliicola]|uniref:NUDIX hydrolase n=1 Tax=Sanyastnella coralliicola TaxID=3069118 RepID=UPI0027BA1C5F|nr:CoA pyrophosphatase [Longitalea sp. SCSIO 12813]
MKDWKDRIQSAFAQDLPGAKAHQAIMSYARDGASEVRAKGESFREGGVLALVYPKDNIAHLNFILRPTYDGVHSGQVAFPGGKREDADRDLEDTALREANEEVGIIPQKVDVIGSLTEVYIPPSNFIVRPYLAIAEERPDFIADEREVEAILEYPLEAFLHASSITQERISIPNLGNVKVGAFKPGEHVIWGATAMMLAELRQMLS